MVAEGKVLMIRTSTVLDSGYEAESSLQNYLEQTDASNRGKLLRAFVRAGFKESRASNAALQAAQHGGDGHGQS